MRHLAELIICSVAGVVSALTSPALHSSVHSGTRAAIATDDACNSRIGSETCGYLLQRTAAAHKKQPSLLQPAPQLQPQMAQQPHSQLQLQTQPESQRTQLSARQRGRQPNNPADALMLRTPQQDSQRSLHSAHFFGHGPHLVPFDRAHTTSEGALPAESPARDLQSAALSPISQQHLPQQQSRPGDIDTARGLLKQMSQTGEIPVSADHGLSDALLQDVPEAKAQQPQQPDAQRAVSDDWSTVPSNWARAGAGVALANQNLLESLLADISIPISAPNMPETLARVGPGAALTNPSTVQHDLAQHESVVHRSQRAATAVAKNIHLKQQVKGHMPFREDVQRALQQSRPGDGHAKEIRQAGKIPQLSQVFNSDSVNKAAETVNRGFANGKTSQEEGFRQENSRLNYEGQELRLKNNELQRRLAEATHAQEVQPRKAAVLFEIMFFVISLSIFVVGLWVLREWRLWRKHCKKEHLAAEEEPDATDFPLYVFGRYSCGLGPELAFKVLVLLLFAAGGFAFLWWRQIIQPFLKMLVVYLYLISVIGAILAVVVYDLFENVLSGQQKISKLVEKVNHLVEHGVEGLHAPGTQSMSTKPTA